MNVLQTHELQNAFVLTQLATLVVSFQLTVRREDHSLGAVVENTPYDVDINGVGATVFVSTYSIGDMKHVAALAFDGNYETYWHSSYTSGTIPSSMKIVFDETQTVDVVKLYKRSNWKTRYGGLCVFLKVSLLRCKLKAN